MLVEVALALISYYFFRSEYTPPRQAAIFFYEVHARTPSLQLRSFSLCTFFSAQLKSSVYQKYAIPVSLGLLLLLIFKLDQ